MDYVIKNPKNVHIMLNSSGRPVTSCEAKRTLFTYEKANNVLNSLPKTLKRMNFAVVPVEETERKEPETIQCNNYKPSEKVTRWVEKFGMCGDVIEEARKREKELVEKLKEVDGEFTDIIHIIELDRPKNLYQGWMLYKAIRENRKRRRAIKDELLIIDNVINRVDDTYLQRNVVQKAVAGLCKRIYTLRCVEESEVSAV